MENSYFLNLITGDNLHSPNNTIAQCKFILGLSDISVHYCFTSHPGKSIVIMLVSSCNRFNSDVLREEKTWLD